MYIYTVPFKSYAKVGKKNILSKNKPAFFSRSVETVCAASEKRRLGCAYHLVLFIPKLLPPDHQF